MPFNETSLLIIGDDREPITLPKSLFFFNDASSKSTPPFASFEPTDATNNPWQSSLAPSLQPNKKIIILDKSFTPNPHHFAENIALVSRLKNAGFRILLRLDDVKNPFFEVTSETKDLFNYFSQLANFDQNQDYKNLAQSGIAKDKTIFLRDVKDDLFQHLNPSKEHLKDELCKVFNSPSDEELDDLLNQILNADKLSESGQKLYLLLNLATVEQVTLLTQNEDITTFLPANWGNILQLSQIKLSGKTAEEKNDLMRVIYENIQAYLIKDFDLDDYHLTLLSALPEQYLHKISDEIQTFEDLNLGFVSKDGNKLDSLPHFLQKKFNDLITNHNDFTDLHPIQIISLLLLNPQKEQPILEHLSASFVRDCDEISDFILHLDESHLIFLLDKTKDVPASTKVTKSRQELLKNLVTKVRNRGAKEEANDLVDRYIDLYSFANEKSLDGIRHVIQNHPTKITDNKDLEKIFKELPLEEAQQFLLNFFSKNNGPSPQTQFENFLKNYSRPQDLVDKVDLESGCILGVDLTHRFKNKASVTRALSLYPEKFDFILKKYGQNLPLVSSPLAEKKEGFIYQPTNSYCDEFVKEDESFYNDIAPTSDYCTPISSPDDKSQTLLHISNLASHNLENFQAQKNNFANVTVARVFKVEDPKLLEHLVTTLPKLQHVILPSNLVENSSIKELLAQNNLSTSYDLDYSKLSKAVKNEEPPTVNPTIPQEPIEEDLSGPDKIESESVVGERNLNRQSQLSLELDSLYQIVEINDRDELDQNSTKSAHKKILVITSEIERHANHFLKADPKNTYYIDSPSKIDFDKLNARLNQSDAAAQIGEYSALGEFLSLPQSSKLLINWTAFSPQQKLALNTAIDGNKRTIAGRSIPENIQVISLTDKMPDDPSFLSRHETKLKSTTNLSDNFTSKNLDKKTIKIDLQGLPNWRKVIFGRIIQEGDQLKWQKSAFVTKLENQESNFEILNISPKNARELKYEVNQAKALGYFNYHNYRIEVPQDLCIETNQEKSFNFAKLKGNFAVTNSVTHEKALGSFLINSHIFDRLLHNKKIQEGQHFETKGLLARFSNKTEPLKLFISENLSEEQWYCLFRSASNKKTKLELYLAPEVKLPPKIKVEELQPETPETSKKIKPKIIVTNNASAIATKGLVFDIEDSSYQDLIERIEFRTTPTGFTDFRKSKSSILDKIESGEAVTLRGKFAPDLLAYLQPLLISKNPNLTVIIEDELVTQGQKNYQKLSWLNPSSYEVKFTSKKTQIPQAKIYSEELDSSALDFDSATKSAAFIKQRKGKFTEMLETSDLLQLVGHSGVGKSSLIREFEREENSKFKICRTDIKSWAQDQTLGKTKILFIDESNIEDQHFVTFAPLKKGGNRTISYQGEIFELTKDHKVVFAHNDKSYGGGRVEQRLFADGTIPEMHLEDFPTAYIYEKILKEAIYDKLKIKPKEQDFREECAELITRYQAYNLKNQSHATNLTVRELQEQALEFVSQKIENCAYSEIKSDNFISTNATKDAQEKIQNTLNIRARQRCGDFPSDAVGINGILLEGDSGSGKSEMIRAILAANQINENEGHPCYYKIDASQTLQKKKEILTKAFEEGNIVWIDELNSCIDDGLEKILNSVLTGTHPDSGKKSANSGFTLLASINQISLEGRSAISPALLHRLQHVKTKPLNEYLTEDLAAIVGNWIGAEESARAGAIAEDFKKLITQPSGQNLNLRTLREVTKDRSFVESYQLPTNEVLHSEVLPPVKNFKEKFAELENYITNYNPQFHDEVPAFLDRRIKHHYSLNYQKNPQGFEKLQTAIHQHEGYDRYFEFDDATKTVQILVPAKILDTLQEDILELLTTSFPQLTKREQVGNNYTIYGLKSPERRELEAADVHPMSAGNFTKEELQQELFYRQKNISQPVAEISNFQELQSNSFCIGEFHHHQSPKRILIDNMAGLKKQGFATIFLEGLIYDSVTQDLLNEYFKAPPSKDMPNPLRELLQTSDACYKNPDFGYYQVVKTAKENGIRCVGLESNYSSTVPKNIAPQDNLVKRLKDLNYAAKAIIERESQGEKWAALMGNAHLKTSDNVLGVSELMGASGIYVYDSTLKKEAEATFVRGVILGMESDARIACPKGLSLKFADITKNQQIPKTNLEHPSSQQVVTEEKFQSQN